MLQDRKCKATSIPTFYLFTKMTSYNLWKQNIKKLCNSTKVTFGIDLKNLFFLLLFNLFLLLFIIEFIFFYYLWVLLHFLILFISPTILFQLFFSFIYNTFSIWVLLHFLILFMSPTILFQLFFSFIYNTFSKKFSVSTE